MKKQLLLVGIILSVLLTMNVLALSNESIQAKQALEIAKNDISEMLIRNISILRANESYQQALQLYNAQLSLEEQLRKADYKLVMNYANEVSTIKASAFKAKDELDIFTDSFEISKKEANLSELEDDYQEIVISFQEERFEDTSKLIDQGYQKISDVQSQQTATRLFVNAATQSIQRFIKENWKWLTTLIVITVIVLVIFWTTIKRIIIKSKINTLLVRKDTLNSLIKKLQNDYFRTKKISETEYHVKLEKFKEMIRDIDRQIPLLKEDLIKIGNKKEQPTQEKKVKIRPRKK